MIKPAVTDEMVEVAAKTRWDYDRADSGDPTEWDMRHPLFREFDTEAMRVALEAVTPLIAAQAWDEGHRAATLEWDHAYDGHTLEPGDASGTCTTCGQGNPYRSADS